MRWTSVVAAIGVGLVACAGGGTPDWHRFVRPQDEEFARAYFDSVRFERIDYAVSELSPVLAQMSGVRDSVVSLARQLPHGPLDSVHLIGVNRFTSSSTDRSELSYEYHSANGWGATSIVVLNEEGRRVIHGMHAEVLPRSLEATNTFTLRDKSVGHYLMIGLVIVCVIVCFGSAVIALFTPMKRRWAWALLALVGAGTFAFNWTTGQGQLGLLNLLLFDAAYGKGGPASPWILQVAFPIGALLTLRRVRSVRHAPAPVLVTTEDVTPAPPVEPIAPATDMHTEPRVET
jgi:hypothetical protein